MTRRKFEQKTYKCLSIFPDSLYLRRSLRRTRWRRIQMTLVGMRASAVPFLLPGPVCRPLRLAARRSRVRAREWMTVGLTIIRPSLISLRTLVREFALPISFCSDGSSPRDPKRVPSKSSTCIQCDQRVDGRTDFAFADACNGRGEPLLGPEVDHGSGACRYN